MVTGFEVIWDGFVVVEDELIASEGFAPVETLIGCMTGLGWSIGWSTDDPIGDPMLGRKEEGLEETKVGFGYSGGDKDWGTFEVNDSSYGLSTLIGSNDPSSLEIEMGEEEAEPEDKTERF